jgi:hypothetical protein
MRETANAYRVLVGKPDAEGPLGKPKRIWWNIKMDFTEIEFGDVDRTDLVQDSGMLRALLHTVMGLRVP